MTDRPLHWLITGASRGIGAAIARRAVDDGGSVTLLARSEDVERVATALGSRAEAVRADVTDVDALAATVTGMRSRHDHLDVVVHDAGLHRGGRVTRIARGDWDQVLAVNLTAAFDLARFCVPLMDAGGGLVMIGAVVGLRGFPGDAPYGASKAGLVGLTQVLAMELATAGIRANCVIPGFVETEMTAGLSEAARERVTGRIPLGRAADPSEVADAVAWVARATYVTGAVIPADGGLLAALGSTA